MAKDKDTFISGLVSELRVTPALPPPAVRAASWFVITVVANVVLLLLVQPFRPGFGSQLIEHPRLLIEVGAALLCAMAGAWTAFVGTVPGERVSRIAKGIVAAVAALFVLSTVTALIAPSPEPSVLGARPACFVEVYAYGGMSLVFLLILTRRGYLRFSPGGSALFGIAAGLVPATLMQLACMYDPWHALHYHYAPVLLLALFGGLLVRWFQK